MWRMPVAARSTALCRVHATSNHPACGVALAPCAGIICAYMLDEVGEAIWVYGCGVPESRRFTPRQATRFFAWCGCFSAAWIILAADAIYHDQLLIVLGIAVPIGIAIIAAIAVEIARRVWLKGRRRRIGDGDGTGPSRAAPATNALSTPPVARPTLARNGDSPTGAPPLALWPPTVECLLREVTELRALALERGATEGEIASRLSAVGIHSKMSENAAATLPPAPSVPTGVSEGDLVWRQLSRHEVVHVPPVLEQGFECTRTRAPASQYSPAHCPRPRRTRHSLPPPTVACPPPRFLLPQATSPLPPLPPSVVRVISALPRFHLILPPSSALPRFHLILPPSTALPRFHLILPPSHPRAAGATRRFIMGTVVGALGVLADTLTEAHCDTSDFAKLFPGHSLWHIMMGWGLLNCMTYAAMLSRNTQAAQGLYLFERYPVNGPNDSRMGGCLWTLRRLYFSFLPGFAFVPTSELRRLGVESRQQRLPPPLPPAAPPPHTSPEGFDGERVGAPRSVAAGKGPPARARVQSLGD